MKNNDQAIKTPTKDSHYLEQFFALLYRINRRNKQERKELGKVNRLTS